MKTRTALILLVLVVLALVPMSTRFDGPRVGSKKFTESVILGDLVTLLAEQAGVEVLHARELGGTRILFDALRAGEIDVYAEYTGTITQEILAGQGVSDAESARAVLAERGILMSKPLGFNNGYAIGMIETTAARLGIRTISDLGRHPDLVFGFSNEFMDRGDGWPSLKEAYGLPQRNVSGMDHDVAYRQLENGTLQVMEVYTTDADIRYYGIRMLEDDRQHFPRYDAVLLYRADLAEREPAMHAAMLALEGQLSEVEVMALNAQARLKHVPEKKVAADFLQSHFGMEVGTADETVWDRFWTHTREHVELVRLSFLLAVVFGLPLGILAAKRPRAGQVILAAVGIVQTIPALALLVVLIEPAASLGLPSVGAGSAAAICALFLYSLLPIVRNACEGLRGVSLDLRESAEALGLSPWARLRLIELPLASRTILAGLKTGAILNVGFATLGALIGAGGYGQPILTGIRLNDYGLILEGALPAAGMALVVQGIFELLDRLAIPRGLRLARA
ncbi:MAG: amino acid ABC transporter permease [Planctomycetes bacterium]|nr:amino acid ABC transporter permease [Planctomycetota bacterium]